MKSTEQLIEEHLAIKEMLKIMEKVAEKLESGEKVDPRHLEAIVDFIRIFADKCHHGKEEGLLFPAMVKVGVKKEGGPIGVMLTEHTLGRKYVREMASGVRSYKKGEKEAASLIVENARKYSALLAQHIDKEDYILYPLADRSLSRAQQVALLEEFDKVEEEIIGAGKHEELHDTLDHYKDIYLNT